MILLIWFSLQKFATFFLFHFPGFVWVAKKLCSEFRFSETGCCNYRRFEISKSFEAICLKLCTIFETCKEKMSIVFLVVNWLLRALLSDDFQLQSNLNLLKNWFISQKRFEYLRAEVFDLFFPTVF